MILDRDLSFWLAVKQVVVAKAAHSGLSARRAPLESSCRRVTSYADGIRTAQRRELLGIVNLTVLQPRGKQSWVVFSGYVFSPYGALLAAEPLRRWKFTQDPDRGIHINEMRPGGKESGPFDFHLSTSSKESSCKNSMNSDKQ